MSDRAIILPSDVSIPEAYRIGIQRSYMEFVDTLRDIIHDLKHKDRNREYIIGEINSIIKEYQKKSKNK